ncbi:PspC domain-containing protein [Bdellovibrio sp. HCB274]|uniref:PspC domain-containing protein n=1 Tax=Bdellovibrio sp. HCB274 TaxID=3394361 RepID=UPI0039B50D3D
MDTMSAGIPNLKYRWVRASDGALGGVCKGLAQAFEIETWMLRIIWLIAVLWFGCGVLLYFTLWYALPRVDRLDHALDGKVLGVCARIAKRYALEVGVVRTTALLFLYVTFGAAILVYGLCYFLIPEAPKSEKSP